MHCLRIIHFIALVLQVVTDRVLKGAIVSGNIAIKTKNKTVIQIDEYKCNYVEKVTWQQVHLNLKEPTLISQLSITMEDEPSAESLSRGVLKVITYYFMPDTYVPRHEERFHRHKEVSIKHRRERNKLIFPKWESSYATSVSLRFFSDMPVSYCEFEIKGASLPFSDEQRLPYMAQEQYRIDYEVISGIDSRVCHFQLYDGMHHHQVVTTNTDRIILVLKLPMETIVGKIVIWFGVAGIGDLSCDHDYAGFTHLHDTANQLDAASNTRLCSPTMYTPIVFPMVRYCNCYNPGVARYLTITIALGNGKSNVSISEIRLYDDESQQSQMYVLENIVNCAERSSRRFANTSAVEALIEKSNVFNAS